MIIKTLEVQDAFTQKKEKKRKKYNMLKEIKRKVYNPAGSELERTFMHSVWVGRNPYYSIRPNA